MGRNAVGGGRTVAHDQGGPLTDSLLCDGWAQVVGEEDGLVLGCGLQAKTLLTESIEVAQEQADVVPSPVGDLFRIPGVECQLDTSGWQAARPVGVDVEAKVGSMYSDLRACTTARVKGVFCGDCAASDAIPLAGDSEVGTEIVTGNGLEGEAPAGWWAPVVLGEVRMAVAGERLLDDDESARAIANRGRGEAGMARRSRVMREVIGSWRQVNTDVGSSLGRPQVGQGL